MKKIALFALAALCVSAAQAISTSWKEATVTADGSFKTGQSFTSSFSLAAVITIADVSTFGEEGKYLIGATNAGANNTGPSFAINQKGGIFGKAHGASYDLSNAGNWDYQSGPQATLNLTQWLKKGENAVALTVKMYQGELFNTTNYTDYTLYINGVEVASATHKGIGGNAYSYNQLAFATGDAYYMDGIATADDIASLTVPEPTSLALLALGVAGLALKRKVA